MKQISRNLLFSSLALFCFVGLAPADTVTITYQHGSGVVQGGYAVGPRSTLVNGSPLSLECDDFLDDVHPGETWTANVSSFDSLTNVRFKQATSAATLKAYDEAAFLYTQTVARPSSEWGNLQFALWAIFDPAVESQPGFATTGSLSSQYWLNLAATQTYTANEFSNVYVYTPVKITGSGVPQEFLGGSPKVPEPGTLLLLASGFAVAGLIRRTTA